MSPICKHECKWEQGLSGMVNKCELLVNVVKINARSRADTLSQRAWRPVERLRFPFSQIIWLPAERQNLTHSVIIAKQGKPECLPMGKSAARQADRHAGKRCPKKQMPCHNSGDSGVLPQCESMPTSDRSLVTITYEEACIKEESEP
ncbi:MAG: hypothetical protein A2Y12_20780 [Planctomycetes bacterium GWF2_42_9]|nr:MAG: hypothetical protein A2Y12_20780 [Planctomycetes bacterium GWF2_42_9]